MHRDKLKSVKSGITTVGFFDNGILVKKEFYDHYEKGEWDRRVSEEEKWNKESGHTTKFLNK